MNILIFVPTYRTAGGTPAIRQQTRESLDALDHGTHKVLTWVSVDDQENRRENIYKQYKRAWDRVRLEGFDALLTIEHDMIVPRDALLKLIEADADIAYGVYLFRENAVLNAMWIGDDALLMASLDNHADERRAAFEYRGPWPVSGAGFGCTLIRANVVQSIDLRVHLHGGKFPDLPLATDVRRAGFKQVAHFGVLCGHICSDGYVLWPSIDQVTSLNYTVPCRIKVQFNGYNDGSHRWRFCGKVGDVVDVPARYASRLAPMGMLEILPRPIGEGSNGSNNWCN